MTFWEYANHRPIMSFLIALVMSDALVKIITNLGSNLVRFCSH